MKQMNSIRDDKNYRRIDSERLWHIKGKEIQYGLEDGWIGRHKNNIKIVTEENEKNTCKGGVK